MIAAETLAGYADLLRRLKRPGEAAAARSACSAGSRVSAVGAGEGDSKRNSGSHVVGERFQ